MGKIAYRFETPAYPGNILYVNLIANYSCTNDCLFCSRPRGKEEIGKINIYEKKAGSFLYLENSPSVNDILNSIGSEIRANDKEIAIIGLGEPLIYLSKVIEVARQIKKKYDIRVRIDTNGSAGCMHKDAVKRLRKVGVDEIRISLNAVNAEDYNKLCRPKFKNVFDGVVGFIKKCVDSKIDTYVSFVVGFGAKGLRRRTCKEYIDFAKSLGVPEGNIILRDYVAPL